MKLGVVVRIDNSIIPLETPEFGVCAQHPIGSDGLPIYGNRIQVNFPNRVNLTMIRKAHYGASDQHLTVLYDCELQCPRIAEFRNEAAGD